MGENTIPIYRIGFHGSSVELSSGAEPLSSNPRVKSSKRELSDSEQELSKSSETAKNTTRSSASTPSTSPTSKKLVLHTPKLVSVKEVLEAIEASMIKLPENLKKTLSKLPIGPLGDPPVLLYQVAANDILLNYLEEKHSSLVELLKLVSKEVPGELQSYVWYPVSDMFYKLNVRYSKRTRTWRYELKPVTIASVISGLARAYRSATRLRTLEQSATYARLRTLMTRATHYVMPGMPAPPTGGWALKELFDILGLPIPVEEDVFIERFKEVVGEPPTKEGLEVLRRIGFIIPKKKKP